MRVKIGGVPILYPLLSSRALFIQNLLTTLLAQHHFPVYQPYGSSDSNPLLNKIPN